MMCEIAWYQFSWEAFATIFTGVLAVGAAYIVGSRQLRILEGQADLAKLSLRHDLFERRYAVYADVRDFLTFIIQHAAYPGDDIKLKFFQAIGLSRFYFGDGVREQLEVIRRKTADLAILKHEMESTYRREGHYGEGNPQKERDLLIWINDQLQNLPSLFGDALRLGG